MPETLFRIRWPDGGVETCYSPSTVIRSHFEAGRAYSLPEFLSRCRDGLHAASERVRARYGGAGCSRAMAQLAAIEARVARQENVAGGAEAVVRIEAFES
jgi:uncharacterized repeat protein (TIGR04042 family)